ncbi:hypothetical protein N7533_004883 [Penicillium manginii]|jgi:hypothetical protein|uniref:uncharacterized protein n=1 Tax=Penicillium manginii TaxID=203109 RepID=UPI002548FF3F|nr:uncharacterized protein N7533_004883 [Penicillium manginii]KAJ5755340.1 hypothetical protein N7533_004883 [Penicillium manginii]
MDLPSSRSFVDHLITELASFEFPSGPEQLRIQEGSQNPFASLPATQLAKVKPIILTLHCLFPNDLLPALDILDRRLVQRLVLMRTEDQDQNQDPDTAAAVPDHHATVADGNTTQTPEDPRNSQTRNPHDAIFLVTSASAAPRQTAVPVPGGAGEGRGGASTPTPTPAMQDPEKGYEVRLNAWNCTCPTFALSAFKDLDSRQGSGSASASSTTMPETRFPEMREMLLGRDAHAHALPVVYPFGGTLTRDTDRGSPPACKHVLACILFARCAGLFGRGDDRLVSLEEMAGWCAGWGG